MPADHRNRLAHEKSPYLLQHAANPVDWWPWSAEALRTAQEEDKPIFLSIGYAACHWCHVMERESFENTEVAQILNTHFVPIKVDREERPDLDEVYMKAVLALRGQGGWPLSVFLTPDLKPFFGGTYFPPEDRAGLPSFRRVLESIVELWRTRREELTRSAEQVTETLHRLYLTVPTQDALSSFPLDAAYAALDASFDLVHGGFGSAPKFPTPSTLFFLLRYYARTRRERALRMVTKTLTQMARGGIHDHLAGGFHRYATDRQWHIPHFEKMLYDNALLARAYVEGYQASGDPEYAAVARRTLDWVLTDMTGADGGFYSSQDADSPGGEGAFYLWRKAELHRLLGEPDGALVAEYYGVTEAGNFEHGTNVLHIAKTQQELATHFGLSAMQIDEKLARARQTLLDERNRRPHPLTDDKILTSWNGLTISALAYASAVLEEPRYRTAAKKAATFILSRLRRNETLLHRYRDGEAAIAGTLEDYAFLAAGLLDLYEATFDFRWFKAAHRLTSEMLQRFYDDVNGGFFLTRPENHVLTPIKDAADGATPSGNSVATLTLARLAEFTSDTRFRAAAEKTLRTFWQPLEANPAGFTHLLCALDFLLGTPKEIIIVGEPQSSKTKELLRSIRRTWLPNKVVALRRPNDERPMQLIPMLEGKTLVRGLPTAYICENYACKLPATSILELQGALVPAPLTAAA